MKKTKIVCTIGPGSECLETIEEMLKCGMNVARFNLSHGSHAEHLRRMELVREASVRTGIAVALMMDTKGPEVRLGTFSGGAAFLRAGGRFTLTTKYVEGDASVCSVSHGGLPGDVAVGDRILLSDGLVSLTVLEVSAQDIVTGVDNDGYIANRKRVAVPGKALSLPPVSESDEEDLLFACKHEIDFIAASFMQRGSDVKKIREILTAHGSEAGIIAKIENKEGVLNVGDILRRADGLMVARGDLGVEIPPEEVPILQKRIIGICNRAGKPVITATQMLESMIEHPRPTRAETSDVANAILDGSDAVMLSGETAKGDYPVEAVRMMARVAEVTEDSFLYRKNTYGTAEEMYCRSSGPLSSMCIDSGRVAYDSETTDAIGSATVSVAESIGAAAILTATETGRTAQSIAKHRPRVRVVAVTPHEKSIRRMQLCWGVEPLKGPAFTDSDDMVRISMKTASENGSIYEGDTVVVTAGVPAGISGTTNMIRVHVACDMDF